MIYDLLFVWKPNFILSLFTLSSRSAITHVSVQHLKVTSFTYRLLYMQNMGVKVWKTSSAAY